MRVIAYRKNVVTKKKCDQNYLKSAEYPTLILPRGRTVLVDRTVLVNRTVLVDRTVFVDRAVLVDRMVLIDRTVLVDRSTVDREYGGKSGHRLPCS